MTSETRDGVLVLTSDAQIRQFVEQTMAGLREHAHPVEAVAHEPELITALRRRRHELAVVDGNGDDAGTLRLLEQIRDLDDQVPVVFVSRKHSAELEQKVRRIGVVAYLLYPLDEERLTQVVRAVASRGRKGGPAAPGAPAVWTGGGARRP